MEIRKATRRKAKLRLGIAAPSGGGKTFGALLLAFGLGGKVGLIDTENGSGDLYAHLGEYDVITLQSPFEVRKYIQAIKAFEDAGYNTIIIDSLSHAWAGEGGLLDKQGKIADQDKYKNSYFAWRQITPEHNSLVETMLQSPANIIATMRSKVEYVLETNEKGKQVPVKKGMAPVQREGMDYEFTVMMDVDQNHNCTASKDRTGIFDGRIFKLDQKVGKELLAWLDQGADAYVTDKELGLILDELDGLTERQAWEEAKVKAGAMKERMRPDQITMVGKALGAADKRLIGAVPPQAPVTNGHAHSEAAE